MFESWRGVVGDIKPTHRPGSLEEFIKLLPDGIGVIPLTVGISSGTEQEFHCGPRGLPTEGRSSWRSWAWT
jgi:hypothetical protein